MKEIENKRVVQGIKTGIHLVSLYKVGWALVPKVEPKTIVTHPVTGDHGFEVVFMDKVNKTFRNIYWVGGEKQKFFEKMLSHIGLNPKDKMKAKEMINKQLWIAICEVVEVKGDEICLDIDNKEIKDHFIFRTFPYVEGGAKPYIEGDPEIKGAPMYEFRKYKDVSAKDEKPVQKIVEAPKVEKPNAGMTANTDFMAEKPVNKKEEVEPNFGDDDIPEVVTVKEEKKPTLADNADEEPNF